MARQWRIEYEGVFDHVIFRGDEGTDIFSDYEDRELFLRLIGEMSDRFEIEIHAWVLMNNHYLLLLRTGKANLLKGMQWLGTTYTRRYNIKHKRYFLKKHALKNRFSIIAGQRGVGKTTAMIQYIYSFIQEDILNKQALYVPVDHFMVVGHSLYEIAEEFVNYGGQFLCLDEIHKYPNWSRELKSIYDSFPNIKLIVSGSSALEIHKGSHDLSRRAVVYKMTGLSLREFIELKYHIELPVLDIESILTDHEKHSLEITKKMDPEHLKILPIFQEYLRHGYFPYFLEHPDESTYLRTLEQGLHMTIESDLLSIYPRLTGVSIKKLKMLLSTIARSAPFTPDMKRLKQIIEVGDERTLKTYLSYLEDGKAITCLSKKNKRIRGLEKPEKIYLNNPNQALAICDKEKVNSGTIRDTVNLC
ncbi:MAG: AAA family ATPase [Desulfobacula sp.]|nr:AAA family ATPase [Desulfobacula sp.]